MRCIANISCNLNEISTMFCIYMNNYDIGFMLITLLILIRKRNIKDLEQLLGSCLRNPHIGVKSIGIKL